MEPNTHEDCRIRQCLQNLKRGAESQFDVQDVEVRFAQILEVVLHDNREWSTMEWLLIGLRAVDVANTTRSRQCEAIISRHLCHVIRTVECLPGLDVQADEGRVERLRRVVSMAGRCGHSTDMCTALLSRPGSD